MIATAKKRIWGEDDFFGPKHLFRQKKMLSLLEKNIKKGYILDAGCGKGDMSLALLKKGFNVTSVDITNENINCLRNRIRNTNFINKIHIIKSELENLKLTKGSLDGIVCGDVLEHVKNDDKVLKNFNLFLKNGRHAIITSPLNEEFWNIDDDWAGHNRRYSLGSLTKVIEKNGFKLEKIKYYGHLFNGYFFHIYLPILKRKLKKIEIPKKRNNLAILKRIATLFYFLFYFDDIFKCSSKKAIYFLADIKKVKEI